MSNAPIGIFDSGVGGLTVARAILDQLPNESTIYIGDTARGPYGPRPLAEVREFALETLDFLVEQGVKALVIACNTASAAMLRDARERYKVPVIEVIQPAVRRAVMPGWQRRQVVHGLRAPPGKPCVGIPCRSWCPATGWWVRATGSVATREMRDRADRRSESSARSCS